MSTVPGIPRVLQRFATCGLLLGGLSFASPVAHAQRVPTAGSVVVGPAASAGTAAIEDAAAERVSAAVCRKQVVVLGELPEHGGARGFGIKARIVERLVRRCGFRAVLFESGSYDFLGLERAIDAARGAPGGAAALAGAATADSLDLALARAIGGFWWTRELAGWRRWLLDEAMRGRLAIGGIDDQLGATGAYARATMPRMVGAAVPRARAAECEEAVARYFRWGYSAAQPYDRVEQARLAECSRLAADGNRSARSPGRGEREPAPDQVMLDDLASYFAREGGDAPRGAAGAPDRDLVMARHVEWWAARLPRDARIVVWTATTHASRARGAHPLLPLGVPPLGQRLAERWWNRLAVVGFTALRGEWARAGGAVQTLAPLPMDALEARALTAGSPRDTVEWSYLDRAALRSLGAVPSRLFGKLATADWSTAFDGVRVVREEGAPTFEPRR
jgi:erythromycin esterase-like protein